MCDAQRGDQVVIVSFYGDRQELTVAPMEDLLDEREDEPKANVGRHADER